MTRVVCLVGFLVVIGAMMAVLPALAQTDSSIDAGPAAEVKYFDFFVVKGGPIAFGLIILSIVTIALTIEHCLSIRRATIVPSEAAQHAKGLIEEKNYLEAIRFTAEDPSMLGYVLNACLVEASNGFVAMERALEETLEERSARLFRKTEYLNIIGNVSPMIGLLGTVTGMILLFAEIHAADTFPGARIVADRIAVALITTFWGLAVAIPALSISAIFRNRIDVLTAECALGAEHLLSVFKPGGASQADEPTQTTRQET
ncbi:MAG: MotA/TolQ/ExbB proton channel family protein [Phycisphaerales bacterium]|nr:MAG: MotA/TolQ/ExbB proton channel family protein [Phycisphaerales bacterium]